MSCIPAGDLLAGAKTITGLTMARYSTANRDAYDRHHEELWRLVQCGLLNPAVHMEIPLDEVDRAHGIIEARANLGKVVLIPGSTK